MSSIICSFLLHKILSWTLSTLNAPISSRKLTIWKNVACTKVQNTPSCPVLQTPPENVRKKVTLTYWTSSNGPVAGTNPSVLLQKYAAVPGGTCQTNWLCRWLWRMGEARHLFLKLCTVDGQVCSGVFFSRAKLFCWMLNVDWLLDTVFILFLLNQVILVDWTLLMNIHLLSYETVKEFICLNYSLTRRLENQFVVTSPMSQQIENSLSSPLAVNECMWGPASISVTNTHSPASWYLRLWLLVCDVCRKACCKYPAWYTRVKQCSSPYNKFVYHQNFLKT